MHPYGIPLIICILIQKSYAIGETYEGRNIQDVPGCDRNAENSHPCERPCENSNPMECRYVFEAEWYYKMSKACFDCPDDQMDCYRKDCVMTNGVKGPIQVYNRSLPGPLINVCKGDQIIVKLLNDMEATTTTIHWHGLHQHGTPYMDGVPFVTQCPIMTGTSFTYNFKASEPGTHLYHSHIGIQRGNGLFGSLVIRDENDPQLTLYEEESPCHVINLIDWFDGMQEEAYYGLAHDNAEAMPTSILINGLGFNNFTDLNQQTPIARFLVTQGTSYRFRVISSGVRDCPIELSIDEHQMQVISTDSYNTRPTLVDSITLGAGERYDFVLTASQSPGTYWIRTKGYTECELESVFQVAILQYIGVSDEEFPPGPIPDYGTAGPTRENAIRLNPSGVGEETDGPIIISQLKALNPIDDDLRGDPDYKFYMHVEFNNVSDDKYDVPPLYGKEQLNPSKWLKMPQINHITYEFASTPLLIEKPNSREFCNAETLRNDSCDENFCGCQHVLEVRLGSTVEIILYDGGVSSYPSSRPFHLHGSEFVVLGVRKINSTVTASEIRRLDEEGEMQRNFENPPQKDTVMVPRGGYVIVRFKADNAGYWLFHSHVDYHAELGMAMVFKVGNNRQIPNVPRNFPRCGSYP